MPEAPRPPYEPAGRPDARAVTWAVALLAGSVALGLIGGVLWGEFAPRAVLQEVSAGTAEVVNAETRAFFGADVWFCCIAAAAGLVTGVLGYWFTVAPRSGLTRAANASALIAGAVAGGLVMLWLGERFGLSAYNHQLATSATGTLFSGSLALGAKSALAIWPLVTSVVLVIAEWGIRPAADQPALRDQPFPYAGDPGSVH